MTKTMMDAAPRVRVGVAAGSALLALLAIFAVPIHQTEATFTDSEQVASGALLAAVTVGKPTALACSGGLFWSSVRLSWNLEGATIAPTDYEITAIPSNGDVTKAVVLHSSKPSLQFDIWSLPRDAYTLTVKARLSIDSNNSWLSQASSNALDLKRGLISVQGCG